MQQIQMSNFFFLPEVAIRLEMLSRQQVPGAACRWCSGNPGKAEGVSFLLSGVENN